MRTKVKSTAEQLIDMGIEQGRSIGLNEGIEQGIEQGIEKGIDLGIEQGQHIANLKIVQKMKERGLNVNEIVELTSLSLETVESLLMEMEQ